MNNYNQTDLNNRDINNNNQINLNKSEEFQQIFVSITNNPQISKKEVCLRLVLKVATISSTQQYYELPSPFYFKKPKVLGWKKSSGD